MAESLDLAAHHAAYLLYTALEAATRLEDDGTEEKPFSTPLKRGLLTCGEALLLTGGVTVLVGILYPRLLEDRDVFLRELQVAFAHEASGEPN